MLRNFSSFIKCPVGPSWSWSYGSWIYNYLCKQCISPLKLWIRIPLLVRYSWYIIMRYKVCQCLGACRWFSPGTLVFSTNITDRQVITQILLKVALYIKTPILTLKCVVYSKTFNTLYHQLKISNNSFKIMS